MLYLLFMDWRNVHKRLVIPINNIYKLIQNKYNAIVYKYKPNFVLIIYNFIHFKCKLLKRVNNK